LMGEPDAGPTTRWTRRPARIATIRPRRLWP
jgi:hypothetical protein